MQTAMRAPVAKQAARAQQPFAAATSGLRLRSSKLLCTLQQPALSSCRPATKQQQPSSSGTLLPAAVPHTTSSSSSSSSRSGVVCHAAMDASMGGAMEQPQQRQAQVAQWLALAGLGCLFAAWYLSNIYFNIYNKQVLKVFAHPLTTTNAALAVSSLLSLFFWATGAVQRPKLSRELLANVLPLALIHVVGNVLTNISLGLVAVSFTNTVKAMEPFFSVLMSALFLGEVPPLPVLATLVPIVGGVLVASLAEASFNWGGFLAAMFSNITFQSRNVLSKKFMRSKGSLDNINLFQLISVMACLLLLPVTLLVDGLPLLPSNLAAAGLDPAAQNDLFRRLLSAGVCFHGYQQLSYMVLGRVAPVTHSIGNCVKRVVVIVASVIAFQNPMSPQNAAGTALALAGVFMYSQVKRRYKDTPSSSSSSDKPASTQL